MNQTSEKPCPRCKELLHWSQNEQPPEVHFNSRTGHVSGVSLMLFCISCGYKQVGDVHIDKDPVWTELRED